VLKHSHAGWGNLALVIVLAASSLTSTITAPAANAGQPKKNLTLEQIYLSGELSPRSPSGLQWAPDGESLTYLEADPQTKLRGLWRLRIQNRQRELLIGGAELRLQGAEEPYEIEHYFLSADQKSVFFTSTLASRGLKTGGDLYQFNLQTREFRAVTRSKELQQIIQVSPDGRKAGFVRGNNLFVVDLESNFEQQLTFDGSESVLNGVFDWVYEEEFGVINGWQWSPDSQYIAFWRLDQSRVPTFPIIDYRPAHPVQYLMRYPKAGDPNSQVHIGVISMSSGKVAWVDTGKDPESYVPRIQWVETGGALQLSLQRLNRTQNQLDVLLADPVNGVSRVLLSERGNTWLDVLQDGPLFINGGKQFLWLSEKDGFNHLYLHDDDGKQARQLTRGSWEVGGVAAVDAEQGWVYFSANKDSVFESHPYRLDLQSGDIKRLDSGPGTHAVDFAPGARAYLEWESSLTQLPKISLRSAADGSLLEMLESNEKVPLGDYAMGTQEFFSWFTSEGVFLNGLMIKPADFDPAKKYPVLMYTYGGPGVQVVFNSWQGSRGLWHHFLTQNGYIVVMVDNRGSGGRGKDFKSATYLNLGDLESRDQAEAARYLAGLPFVDGTRIGLWGWSYGGYLTALTLCKSGSVFKAGVSVAPVTDWSYYDSIYTERFMRTPVENPAGYRVSSPIEHAGDLQARLLLVHGTGDDNVHFQNSVTFVKALVEKNRKFDLLYYPDATHGIYEGPYTRYHLFEAITRFVFREL
jgi:dipeptidyl-peptidase 4